MEKFMQRENALLGYVPQRLPGSSPKTSHGSSEDMDFNDVFGGPPKRFSMQEVRVRYSLGETVESEEITSLPWSALKEKPVFGEDAVARRRHTVDDFFDDIFKGDDSYSSPRRSDWDRDNIFGSNPGSRIMSPSRPLPPKGEPFGTSIPSQFSLPAKLSKAGDLPTYGSRKQSHHKLDAGTNGLNSPHSPSTPLSRLSNQGFWGHEEIRSEVHPMHSLSPLSRKGSFGSEISPSMFTTEHRDAEDFSKDRKSVDSKENHFHFSIYKWPGRGIPMLMPLAGGNMKSGGASRYERSAGSNGRTKSDYLEGKTSILQNHGLSVDMNSESLTIDSAKNDSENEKEIKEMQNTTEEAVFIMSDSKSHAQNNIDFIEAKQNATVEEEVSLNESGVRKKSVEVPQKIKDYLKSEKKPLHVLLADHVEQPGNSPKKKGKIKTTTGDHHDEPTIRSRKKIEEKVTELNGDSVDRPCWQGEAKTSAVSPGKSGVKGKVRDFVHIFNLEADMKPKADVHKRSQSSRWKAKGIEQNENGAGMNAAVKEKLNLHSEDNKPDYIPKVEEKLDKDEQQKYPPTKAPSFIRDQFSTRQKIAFSSESFRRDSKSVGNSEDLFGDNFLVEELTFELKKVAQADEGSEDMQALDANIQQWSVGKKGNIRSLLSTLQYVLWPGSGWTPVPLVDLIEANSVKRAYQKALLRLHPDKLQQKGAASSQKYIAEKVFDILQEAWDHFNTLTPL